MHKLTELALGGRLGTDGSVPIEEVVRKTWQELVTKGRQHLEAAWAPAAVPVPSQWPNYQLLSIRAVKRCVRLAVEHQGTLHLADKASQSFHAASGTIAEHEFRDGEIGLRGTPDMVERKAGTVRVLDLKTGLRQAGPTADQRRQLLLYAHLVGVHDKSTPDECAIVDGAGQEHPVPVTDADVELAVKEASDAVAAYNDSVQLGDVMVLARPSSSACRWCSFRAVCRPYFEARQPDWPGARGDVHGRIITCVPASPGETDFTLEAEFPAYLAGENVRVTGIAHGDVSAADPVSVIEADLLGGPKAQRLRWDSTVVTLPDHQVQQPHFSESL